MCKDGSACNNYQTCCQLSDGHWGCWIYNQETYCEEKIHCCAIGTASSINDCVKSTFNNVF